MENDLFRTIKSKKGPVTVLLIVYLFLHDQSKKTVLKPAVLHFCYKKHSDEEN